LIFLLNCIKIQQQKTLLLDERKNNKHYLMQVPYFPIETTNIREQFAAAINTLLMDAATDLLMKIVVMLETRSKLDNDKN
jgi:nicotinic acid mononucleotide adenylyltransferase